MSCILKFITFTLEVKRRLWSASHPETVLQWSQPCKRIDQWCPKFLSLSIIQFPHTVFFVQLSAVQEGL